MAGGGSSGHDLPLHPLRELGPFRLRDSAGRVGDVCRLPDRLPSRSQGGVKPGPVRASVGGLDAELRGHDPPPSVGQGVDIPGALMRVDRQRGGILHWVQVGAPQVHSQGEPGEELGGDCGGACLHAGSGGSGARVLLLRRRPGAGPASIYPGEHLPAGGSPNLQRRDGRPLRIDAQAHRGKERLGRFLPGTRRHPRPVRRVLLRGNHSRSLRLRGAT
mmetsp:Transcript_35872/g.84902  ORF Transcript_35872/g.84902 Transcript_35872/m.84902 type:complete len:218 (-) Transcript_35872:19-672(-)